MIQYFKYILIVVFLLNNVPLLIAQEFRGGIEYNKEIIRNIEGGVKYQLRDNFNSKNNYNNLIQTSLTYSVNKHLNLSGSYRYVFGRETNNDELEDNTFEKNRLTTGITVKSKRLSNDVKIYYRFRYQYSWGNNEKDKHYLRNRVKLDYKLSGNTRPFIAFEPYYNLTDRSINKFRTSLGSQFQLRKNKIDIYIITEAKIKDSRLATSHFVGFTYIL